jgi:hypothetical protein
MALVRDEGIREVPASHPPRLVLCYGVCFLSCTGDFRGSAAQHVRSNSRCSHIMKTLELWSGNDL